MQPEEILGWLPKGFLIILVVALSSACVAVIRSFISKTHKEIIIQFGSVNKSLQDIREQLKNVVMLEQHKETREDLKDDICDLRRRLERLEK